jgi:TolB-like protein
VAQGGGEGQTADAHSSMHEVFLSYASQDAAVATAVVEALERSGIACWIAPRDVTPGTFYGDEIVHAIDAAKASVLILSQNSAASQHVLREVERAASKRHAVVSLRIDQAPLPAGLEYFLNTSQWLDASGADATRMMPKLVAAVRLAIERPATPDAEIAGTPLRTSAPVGSDRSQRRTAIVAGSIVAVAIAGFVGYRLWLSGHEVVAPAAAVVTGITAAAAPAISEKSVAVLPFVDMSEKKDQEYFGDGMAEELLNLLAKIPDLKVIGRTSSFQFKGKSDDLRKMGAALGAAYVVEGSVRRAGDRVRITAQLIDAQTGVHRWSDTYDRSFSDVLAIQNDIASDLARALQIELDVGSADQSKLNRVDVRAYEAYLRGLHARERFDRAGMQEAISDFQQALELDPHLLPAMEALSVTFWDMSGYGFWDPEIGYRQAKAVAERALKIDSNSAIAHALLCTTNLKYEWNWEAASSECEKARMSSPRLPYVLNASANLRMATGAWAESESLLDAARAADPLDPRVYDTIAQVLLREERYGDSERALRRLISISPTYAWAHCALAITLLGQSRKEEALEEAKRESDPMIRALGLTLTYHALNRHQAADAAMQDLQTRAHQLWPMSVAEAYSYRGHKDDAFEWLDRAYTEKDSTLFWIKGDPLMHNLVGDPRYKTFLRKMNLPE